MASMLKSVALLCAFTLTVAIVKNKDFYNINSSSEDFYNINSSSEDFYNINSTMDPCRGTAVLGECCSRGPTCGMTTGSGRTCSRGMVKRYPLPGMKSDATTCSPEMKKKLVQRYGWCRDLMSNKYGFGTGHARSTSAVSEKAGWQYTFPESTCFHESSPDGPWNSERFKFHILSPDESDTFGITDDMGNARGQCANDFNAKPMLMYRQSTLSNVKHPCTYEIRAIPKEKLSKYVEPTAICCANADDPGWRETYDQIANDGRRHQGGRNVDFFFTEGGPLMAMSF